MDLKTKINLGFLKILANSVSKQFISETVSSILGLYF